MVVFFLPWLARVATGRGAETRGLVAVLQAGTTRGPYAPPEERPSPSSPAVRDDSRGEVRRCALSGSCLAALALGLASSRWCYCGCAAAALAKIPLARGMASSSQPACVFVHLVSSRQEGGRRRRARRGRQDKSNRTARALHTRSAASCWCSPPSSGGGAGAAVAAARSPAAPMVVICDVE